MQVIHADDTPLPMAAASSAQPMTHDRQDSEQQDICQRFHGLASDLSNDSLADHPVTSTPSTAPRDTPRIRQSTFPAALVKGWQEAEAWARRYLPVAAEALASVYQGLYRELVHRGASPEAVQALREMDKKAHRDKGITWRYPELSLVVLTPENFDRMMLERDLRAAFQCRGQGLPGKITIDTQPSEKTVRFVVQYC